MKKLFFMTAAILAAATFTGCKEKPATGDIITQKVVKKKPGGPVAMQQYTDKRDINWAGSRMTCEIKRSPDRSLPMVKDDNGRQHIDNRITLTIRRADGSVFLSKEFTKTTFDGYLSDDYRKRGTLEGLVFDHIDGPDLRFAASVSFPETDEYIPLTIVITPQGAMSIAVDNNLDTSGDDADDGN